VKIASQNAQSGLNEALNTEISINRKYITFEKWKNGQRYYKVTIRKIDDQTFRFRIIGYHNMDEVTIITHRIEKDDQYYTLEEFKKLKQPKKEKE
jgi:hypothetical protein